MGEDEEVFWDCPQEYKVEEGLGAWALRDMRVCKGSSPLDHYFCLWSVHPEVDGYRRCLMSNCHLLQLILKLCCCTCWLPAQEWLSLLPAETTPGRWQINLLQNRISHQESNSPNSEPHLKEHIIIYLQNTGYVSI